MHHFSAIFPVIPGARILPRKGQYPCDLESRKRDYLNSMQKPLHLITVYPSQTALSIHSCAFNPAPYLITPLCSSLRGVTLTGCLRLCRAFAFALSIIIILLVSCLRTMLDSLIDPVCAALQNKVYRTVQQVLENVAVGHKQLALVIPRTNKPSTVPYLRIPSLCAQSCTDTKAESVILAVQVTHHSIASCDDCIVCHGCLPL
jgi:hypothetical protein